MGSIDRELIDLVRNSNYGISIENKYRNQVAMSGWILTKPHYAKHDKKKRDSVSIVLCQFERDSNGVAYINTFNLISYLPNIMEKLKDIKYVTFVVVNGQLQWNRIKRTYYPQIYDMELLTTLDIELKDLEEYKL